MPAIQPCALLFVVGPDWQVETVSANVGMLGDFRPAAVIGQPLSDLIGSKAVHNLRNRVAWLAGDESEVQDFGAEWGDAILDMRATRDEERYLVEAELAVEARLPDGIGMVRSMTDRLTGGDPVKMAERAMRQLCSLIGFDRVVLADRQSNVVAAGHHGNAPKIDIPGGGSEIPRLVADRDSEPVPLVGEAEGELLGRAAYQALSAEELEALTRQETAATITLPLRIDGEMVASLHAAHPVARRCGLERRAVAHLFAERLVARMTRFGWQP